MEAQEQSKQAEKLNDIRDELAISLAKAILESTVATRESLAKSTTLVSTVSIPAYLAVLKFYGQAIENINVWLVAAPIVFWIGALLVCMLVLLPKNTYIDFKNLPAIHNMHYEALKRARHQTLMACSFQIIGYLFVAWVLVFSS